MVIILSEANDYSTLEVISWLKFYNVDFVRINSDERIQLLKIDLQNDTFLISVNDKIIDLLTVDMIWHRRGTLTFLNDTNIEELSLLQKQDNAIINYYLFVAIIFAKRNILGNYLTSEPNKLVVLKLAKKVGLETPKTFLSGKKTIVKELMSGTKLVTKTLSRPVTYMRGTFLYHSYTEEISKNDLNKFGEYFFPSLIQSAIEKKFEIRSFFLVDKFYSMAIFSQQNEKTITDFRKYDSNLPNRAVPFILPKAIEQKLIKLMSELSLNTASIDLIINKKGQYIFLEVNPVGQFGMVSRPCNYYLEKKIAKIILKNERQSAAAKKSG